MGGLPRKDAESRAYRSPAGGQGSRTAEERNVGASSVAAIPAGQALRAAAVVVPQHESAGVPPNEHEVTAETETRRAWLVAPGRGRSCRTCGHRLRFRSILARRWRAEGWRPYLAHRHRWNTERRRYRSA